MQAFRFIVRDTRFAEASTYSIVAASHEVALLRAQEMFKSDFCASVEAFLDEEPLFVLERKNRRRSEPL